MNKQFIFSMTTRPEKSQLIKHCTEAASAIHTECAEILSAKDHHDQVTTNNRTSLAGCGPALVELLSRQAKIVHILYQDVIKIDTTTPIILDPDATQKYTLALKRLEDIASIAYTKFYAYVFKDLPVCWRQLYTEARILKFCLLFLRSPYAGGQHESDGGSSSDDDAAKYDGLDELVKMLDLALVLAGAAGERRGRGWIDKALELLHRIWLAEDEDQDINGDAAASHDRPVKRAKLTSNHDASNIHDAASATFSTNEPFTPPVAHPIRTVSAPSIEEFQTYMDRPRDAKLGPEPLILQNTLTEWPALGSHPWNQPSYLLSQTFAGRRLVPVEVGRSYVDEGWGQKLITFGEFLRGYMTTSEDTSEDSSPDRQIAYLAQHQLFTQLPSLRNDILIPDYCYTSAPPHPTDRSIDQPELEAPLLNAWLGPAGTISPLHNDPYHNILAQVVGRKYVRLYAPRETPRLVARGKENGVEMGNTSALDVGVVEGWDHPTPSNNDDEQGQEGEREEGMPSEEDINAFKSLPFVDCILGPGDALYIPIGWWHYVRGLSVSFSVSFWWN
ncbi:hypothetical protein F4803DRAFT_498801 [Xylaria telfairii]|nr:hypothetical protein F4803DRAFT_498801 [Xylaria telfairii]